MRSFSGEISRDFSVSSSSLNRTLNLFFVTSKGRSLLLMEEEGSFSSVLLIDFHLENEKKVLKCQAKHGLYTIPLIVRKWVSFDGAGRIRLSLVPIFGIIQIRGWRRGRRSKGRNIRIGAIVWTVGRRRRGRSWRFLGVIRTQSAGRGGRWSVYSWQVIQVVVIFVICPSCKAYMKPRLKINTVICKTWHFGFTYSRCRRWRVSDLISCWNSLMNKLSNRASPNIYKMSNDQSFAYVHWNHMGHFSFTCPSTSLCCWRTYWPRRSCRESRKCWMTWLIDNHCKTNIPKLNNKNCLEPSVCCCEWYFPHQGQCLHVKLQF